VRFPGLATRGLFAACRQPIYLGFALTLWTGPVWTPDHLLLAVLWSTYCLLGPLLKEKRFLRFHGAEFAAYRRAVPYMLPVKRNPR
jgi:protein-S-isoprenylcysteine O-methyltransferase Ste14